MDYQELDLAILKVLLTNKKHSLEFSHECNEKLFAPDLWRFAKLVIDYIRVYKEVPTKRVMMERTKASKNDALLEHVGSIFSKIEEFKYDDKEYKHDLEKLKNRFAEKLINNYKDDLTASSGPIDIKKNMMEMQSVLQHIKAVNQAKAYEQHTLKESIQDFRSRYMAKMKDPNFGIGLMTGYSFFDFTTSGLRPGEMLLIGADTGGGKCHAKGQGILKQDGTIVKVEDIKVGDNLAGYSGSRTVLKTNIGNGLMYDIVPVKGKPWRVNADHILTVVMTKTNEIIDVSVKDYMEWSVTQKHCAKLFRSPMNFSKSQSSAYLLLDPYLLGVIVGDGSTMDNSIMITSADQEIVEELSKNCIKLGLHITVRAISGMAKTYGLAGKKGYKNPIAKALEHYKLRFVNCHNKFIPIEYKTAEKSVRLEILAGLMDTDGSHNGRGGFDFISASKQLSEDVVFISRSVGLAAYITQCEKGCQTGSIGTYYRVSISGNTQIIPCRIQRKKAPARKQKKDVLRTGFKVIPTNNIEDYYGFTLDGDGRYLLDDFTVTHNSMLLMNMAINMWLQGNTIEMDKDFKEGCDVLYFSLEMPFEDCMERVLSRLALVPQKGIRDAKLTADQQPKLGRSIKFVNNYGWDFEIVDVPRGASIETIELIFNDVCSRKRKPKVVVIDYLTLMDYKEKELDDWLKQGKISEQLHEFGRVHEVVMLSAVQLNDPKSNGKVGESQVGLHRIGRSKMIMHNANFGMQIEKRPNEEQFPDMSLHLIKSRRTELTRGKIHRDFSCCALLDSPNYVNTDTFNPDDISDKMELFNEDIENDEDDDS